MNIWTRKSIELANQKNYLDLLYRVYPISENVRREISDSTKNDISNFFNGRNNIELLKILIDQTNKKQIVFPIKDKEVIKIAIIDGVIYIDKCAGQKMARKMRNDFNDNEVILSAVLLRNFLYSL